MKAILHSRFIPPMAALMVGGSLIWGGSIAAAESNAAAKHDKTDASTNPAPAAIEIPKSEFSMPASVAQGRDPFFPNSSRITAARTKPDSNQGAPVAPPVALVLQGISGTDAKRFALISRRTFEAGEEGDVTVGKAKVRVRCLVIKEDSVMIEVDGKPQELRLRPGL